jgi:N-acetylglucosamine kinase
MSLTSFPAADAAVFCADIGGSFIRFGVSRRIDQVEEYEKVPMPANSWQAFVATMADLMTRYGAEISPSAVLAISSAGLISPQTGNMLSTNIPAFTGRSLAADLSREIGRPVTVANDADCFTFAEACIGHAQHQAIVAGIILGTGVGGGLVINGELVRGQGGVTGEWGHGAIVRTTLSLNGHDYPIPRLPCACGQMGCLDTLGGARGMERIYQHFNGGRHTSRQIIEGWLHGQAEDALTVQAWLQLVAEPLAFLIKILGPTRIVVGGGLASADQLITALDQQVRTGTLHHYPDPLVIAGKFNAMGGMIGASLLARQASARRV